MNSMTGFGRRDFRDDRVNITVEIKTVNHRFKDFMIKMPRILGGVEERIRKTIGQALSRGRIEVYIKYDTVNGNDQAVVLNQGLALSYMNVLNQLKDLCPEVSDTVSMSLLAKFPDVITVEETIPDDDAQWLALEPVLAGALEQVVQARAREGAALKADMAAHAAVIAEKRDQIARMAPEMLVTYREGLKNRVQALLEDAAVDEQRLLTEVAVMADKLAIDEELTRLSTHLDRLNALLAIEDEPVGRQLDFLIQELNREINTIGSKANDVRIGDLVVDVKSEIEKIREQVQNIE